MENEHSLIMTIITFILCSIVNIFPRFTSEYRYFWNKNYEPIGQNFPFSQITDL